jgi:hypothetical protein
MRSPYCLCVSVCPFDFCQKAFGITLLYACLCVAPIVARQLAIASYYILLLFVCVYLCSPRIFSFTLRSVSYQKEVGDEFSPKHLSDGACMYQAIPFMHESMYGYLATT